jgi:two-component system sensor histidine kinase HydH
MRAMNVDTVLGCVAAAVLYALAAMAFRRFREDAEAPSLAALVTIMATWSLAIALHGATGEPAFHAVDIIVSPLTPPLVLQMVVTATGHLRRLRGVLVAAWCWFGGVALLSLAAIVVPEVHAATVDGVAWSLAFLVGWLPLKTLAIVLLVRQMRAHRAVPPVALRAGLILVGIVAAGLFAVTELVNDFIEMPGLGLIGSAVSAAVLTAVVLRFRFTDGPTGHPQALFLFLSALIAVVGALFAAALLPSQPALALLLVAVFTGLLTLLWREYHGVLRVHREHLGTLVRLGRFSAQMAHDLKNPLAALKGALQFLETAAASPAADRAVDPLRAAWERIGNVLMAQTERLQAIIERYQHMARVVPRPRATDPLALASSSARDRLSSHPSIRLVDRIAEAASEPRRSVGEFWFGDPDLLRSAFDNIVANAVEAMANGGTLTVSGQRRGDAVEIAFSDDGPGIEPRLLERVQEDFFTQKAHGTGLGLAFARRVALAHGGGLVVASAPGQGTTITFTLPSSPRPTGAAEARDEP